MTVAASDARALFDRRERLASRGLFLAGVVALALGAALTADHRLPPALLLAWAAVLGATKVVLALWALRTGWRAWPALLLEGAAFGAVAVLVTGVLPAFATGWLFAAAALLMGAGWVRRRAAAADETDGPDGSDEGAAS